MSPTILPSLPSRVRFLLTGRFHDPRLQAIFPQPYLDLIDHAPADKDDVLEYAKVRLKDLTEPQFSLVTLQIAKASRGNFLYARYILDDLIARPQLPENLVQLDLPDGLNGIYLEFIQRELTVNNEKWNDRYRPLLGLLAVAHPPGLTREQLIDISGLEESQVDDILKACAQYLTGALPNGPFGIYHRSFRDFLTGEGTYKVYPSELNRKLGECFLKVYAGDWSNCADDYAIRYTPAHLAEAVKGLDRPAQSRKRGELLASLADLLLDFNWICAKLQAAGIHALLADYDLLAPTTPNQAAVASEARGDSLNLVCDALRLSAYVLSQDKQQTCPSVAGTIAALRASITDQKPVGTGQGVEKFALA